MISRIIEANVTWLLSLPVWFALALTIGCDQKLTDKPQKSQSNLVVPAPAIDERKASAITKTLWLAGETHLNSASKNAHLLQEAIKELLNNPKDQAMTKAKEQWRRTMQPIERFFVFLQLAKVYPERLEVLKNFHSSISSWPIQPGYLDKYGSHQWSGIVFDIQVPITDMSLRQLHGMTDREEGMVGLYPLQFVLAGEPPQRNTDALAPIKHLSQEHKQRGYQKTLELPSNRRRTLLRLQASLLKKDIKALSEQWTDSSSESIKHHLISQPPEEQMRAFIEAAAHSSLHHLRAWSQLTQAKDLSDPRARAELVQYLERLTQHVKGLDELISTLHHDIPMEQELSSLQTLQQHVDLMSHQITSAENQPLKLNQQTAYNALKNLIESLLKQPLTPHMLQSRN